MSKYNDDFVKRYSRGTFDQECIIKPALMRVLGDVKQKRVIDIGCGTGNYSRFLAERGATVTGIDRSKNQLRVAIDIEKTNKLGINYINSNVCAHNIGLSQFDIALLAFVILDLPSPAVVQSVINSAQILLQSGGLLVIADVHPHNINRNNEIEYFYGKHKKGYFDNGATARSESWLENGEKIIFDPNYHYRLDFLINTLIDSNFEIARLLEPEYRIDFPTHIILGAKCK